MHTLAYLSLALAASLALPAAGEPRAAAATTAAAPLTAADPAAAPTALASVDAPAVATTLPVTADALSADAVPEFTATPQARTGPARADVAFAGPVRRSRLAQTRGGADTGSTTITLSGVVSGNAATNVTTGNNTIDASSFANASGIPIVIQNTGANVLIQNATVINLQLK